MKKLKYLLLLLCIPVLFTGCKKIPKLENGQEVVVEVAGKQFTADELFEVMLKNYGTQALVNLVDEYVADQELTDELKNEAKKNAQSEYDLTYARYSSEWDKFLSYNEFNSSEEFLEQLIKNEKQVLALQKYIKENVITNEEINTYYNEEVFGEITVRHILIIPEVTDNMTAAEKTEAEKKALEEAKELIEQLKSSKNLEEDFIALAKEKSDDTGSASNGGLIENFTNKSGLVKEFWEASLKLEVGKLTSAPVQSQYGYHIIYKVKQNDKPSLDTVKEKIISDITASLLNDYTGVSTQIYLAGLREKHGMKIYNETLNDEYKAAINNFKKQQ